MKKIKKFSFLIVILVLIASGLLAWWVNATSAADISDKTKKTFVIKRGENVREIANHLKSEGLIKDPVIFFILVKRLGLDEKIQAGDFFLSPSMNASEIAKALQVGTSDMHIVIPEGKRAQEIADKLEDTFPTYDDSWRGKLIVNEGYLFPDTYSFPKDATIEQIIEIMRANFEEKYSGIPISGGNSLSKEQIVILASMVEREAKHPEDRPLVASVMLNRIELGMPLYIDASIQYALGTPRKWWPVLTDTGSNVMPNSPYNTYTHGGLPPTPISNPGYEALKAVMNPAKTDYLYYISDKSGNNRYGKTLEEHNANISKYGL